MNYRIIVVVAILSMLGCLTQAVEIYPQNLLGQPRKAELTPGAGQIYTIQSKTDDEVIVQVSGQQTCNNTPIQVETYIKTTPKTLNLQENTPESLVIECMGEPECPVTGVVDVDGERVNVECASTTTTTKADDDNNFGWDNLLVMVVGVWLLDQVVQGLWGAWRPDKIYNFRVK